MTVYAKIYENRSGAETQLHFQNRGEADRRLGDMGFIEHQGNSRPNEEGEITTYYFHEDTPGLRAITYEQPQPAPRIPSPRCQGPRITS